MTPTNLACTYLTAFIVWLPFNAQVVRIKACWLTIKRGRRDESLRAPLHFLVAGAGYIYTGFKVELLDSTPGEPQTDALYAP